MKIKKMILNTNCIPNIKRILYTNFISFTTKIKLLKFSRRSYFNIIFFIIRRKIIRRKMNGLTTIIKRNMNGLTTSIKRNISGLTTSIKRNMNQLKSILFLFNKIFIITMKTNCLIIQKIGNELLKKVFVQKGVYIKRVWFFFKKILSSRTFEAQKEKAMGLWKKLGSGLYRHFKNLSRLQYLKIRFYILGREININRLKQNLEIILSYEIGRFKLRQILILVVLYDLVKWSLFTKSSLVIMKKKNSKN